MRRKRTFGARLRKAQRGGLTLIEVSLALAILAIGVFVLCAAASRCLAVITASRNFEAARRALDLGQLDYPLERTTNSVLNMEVSEASCGDDFTFSRKIEPIEGDEDSFIVRDIVEGSGRGRKSRLEVVGYIYTTNHP